jgi:hypothetical protein
MIRFLLLYIFYILPENTLSIRVLPLWENSPMTLHTPYQISNDTLRVQQWKCYIQVCALYKNNQLVYTFGKNHHLLDAERDSSFVWSLSLPQNTAYDAIECEIGVDSTTQMQGVQGNDLDPEHDMYWSWQSGYIHTKVEASLSNRTRNYTLHIGGYRAPYNTLQRIRFPVHKAGNILLTCPIDKWVNKANSLPNYQIMRPCLEAVQLANEWAKTWRSEPI